MDSINPRCFPSIPDFRGPCWKQFIKIPNIDVTLWRSDRSKTGIWTITKDKSDNQVSIFQCWTEILEKFRDISFDWIADEKMFKSKVQFYVHPFQLSVGAAENTFFKTAGNLINWDLYPVQRKEFLVYWNRMSENFGYVWPLKNACLTQISKNYLIEVLMIFIEIILLIDWGSIFLCDLSFYLNEESN